jgi:hypothetical protein
LQANVARPLLVPDESDSARTKGYLVPLLMHGW